MKVLKKGIKYFTDKGFFVCINIQGFFSGVWYYLRGPLEKFLLDICTNVHSARRLIQLMGDFNLRVIKNCVELGAYCISWPDDLGWSRDMFISPEQYKKLIYPWHKRAIELAHKHDAFVNMHGHGDINLIVPLLVKAKLDILNPVGPTDNMNLAELKEKYGDHLTLQGGLSKFIGNFNPEELAKHVMDRIAIGGPGGGFILGTEGGISPEMSIENFDILLRVSRKYRRNRRIAL